MKQLINLHFFQSDIFLLLLFLYLIEKPLIIASVPSPPFHWDLRFHWDSNPNKFSSEISSKQAASSKGTQKWNKTWR